jgi:hypothetical protein
MLKESLEKFTALDYGKLSRTSGTYQTVARYCSSRIAQLIKDYHAEKNDRQLLREVRNDIDYYLRRYHEYCIQQRTGAHYHEIGVNADSDFEHLIPAARIRDLLLFDVISVEQALNAPTVQLSRTKHKMLKNMGWGSKTPDMWRPFLRYANIFDAQYRTYDEVIIDPITWTLEQHYKHFQHLLI